jgi:hypothetical protein
VMIGRREDKGRYAQDRDEQKEQAPEFSHVRAPRE